MTEAIHFIDPTLDNEPEQVLLTLVADNELRQPYSVQFADFFAESGASLVGVTKAGKQIQVESAGSLRARAYCEGIVGKGGCTGPLIDVDEVHIETRVVNPVNDKEKGRRFYHTDCYVKNKLDHLVDVVDVKPAQPPKDRYSVGKMTLAAWNSRYGSRSRIKQ